MRIKKMSRLIHSLMPHVMAFTIAPFGIFYRDKLDTLTMVHEITHYRQQLEMLVLPFFLWYLIEWLIKLPFKGKKAYYSISFEREAYNNEDWAYLRSRKHYAWIKYLFHNIPA